MNASTEIIGNSLKIFISVASKATLAPVLRACAQSGLGNKQNVRVECMKRSGEKFPAICSLSLASLKGRKMILCFFSDITEEENHQNALDAEKANAESLLLNILPKDIALRVKNNAISFAPAQQTTGSQINILFFSSSFC